MREKIQRGAFKNTIKEDDIRMLQNHDPNYVIGRNASGTLKLMEDNKGLYFEAIPPDTQWARDLITSINRKDITQNSFQFSIIDQGWGMEDGIKTRTLKEVKLIDVSAVTFPAYPDTTVWVRKGWNLYTFNDPLKFGVSADPTAFLPRNSTQAKEDDEAQPPPVVQTAPLIDPFTWTKIKNNIRRFTK